MRLTFSQAYWLGSFRHSKNIVVLLSLHKWRLMSPVFAIPLKISYQEFCTDCFTPLLIIHVTVQQRFMCMTVTCMWLVHTGYIAILIMAAYSSTFMEVKHAEFTRTVLKTAEFKWEGIWISWHSLLVIGASVSEPLSSDLNVTFICLSVCQLTVNHFRLLFCTFCVMR